MLGKVTQPVSNFKTKDIKKRNKKIYMNIYKYIYIYVNVQHVS